MSLVITSSYEQSAPEQPAAAPAIHARACSIDELKGYAKAMSGFLRPDEPLPFEQAAMLLSMIMGVQAPQPQAQAAPRETGAQMLNRGDQSSNPYNRLKKPANVQLVNKPKAALKQHHFNDPKEMQRMAQYDQAWEAKQRGMPDVAGVPEINRR